MYVEPNDSVSPARSAAMPSSGTKPTSDAGKSPQYTLGARNDVRAAPIRHIQNNPLHHWPRVHQLLKVSGVDVSPAVNGLVVVSNYADVAVTGDKILNKLKLNSVRVLILVDLNVVELCLMF